MKPKRIAAVCILAWLVVAVADRAVIADRCSGVDPLRIVFCDDFDDYCDPPPAGDDACEHDYGVCVANLCEGGSTPGAACNDNYDCPPVSFIPPDNASFLTFWPQADGVCNPNAPYSLQTNDMWKPNGYAVQVPQNKDIQRLVRHIHDVTPEILANPANTAGKNAMNGSGVILSHTVPEYVDPSDELLMPDVLKGQFFVHGSSIGAYGYMIIYLELFLDNDHAPVNYRMTDCYPEAQGPYDLVLPTDGDVHASFAFGLLAKLDPNPCFANGNDRRPQIWRAVVFDGLTWRQLKHPVFDLPNGDAELKLDKKYNRFYYYIGTDAIEIRLRNAKSEQAFSEFKIPNEYYVARVPRQYFGPFNKVAMGAAKGVDVGPGLCSGRYGNTCLGGMNEGNPCTTDSDCPPYVGSCVANVCVGGTNHGNACAGDEDCPDAQDTPDCLMAPPISNNAKMEEVVLYDGVFQNVDREGACCLPNGSCLVTSPDNCGNTLGGVYNGDFTACGEFLCCPDPFADADGDGDADQNDFGKFQACFTGAGPTTLDPGCECFDRDGDDDVDEDDWGAFEACASGPDVPANPACDG